MARVHSLNGSIPAIEAAVDAGYVHYPYKLDVMHWFCKPSPGFRTHHLHLVPKGSAVWSRRVAFRDAPRASASLAAEYAAPKMRLATMFPHDREAYTQAKDAFIQRALLIAEPSRHDARDTIFNTNRVRKPS